jgi:hypothetical protein
MASATIIIYSLRELGISRTLVRGAIRRLAIRAPSILSLPPTLFALIACLGGMSKSFVKNEKAGRGGGDRTKSDVETPQVIDSYVVCLQGRSFSHTKRPQGRSTSRSSAGWWCLSFGRAGYFRSREVDGEI